MSAYTPQQLEAAIAQALKTGNTEIASKLAGELNKAIRAPANEPKPQAPVLAHEEWAGGRVQDMTPLEKMWIGAKAAGLNAANAVVELGNKAVQKPYKWATDDPTPVKPLFPKLDSNAAVSKQAVQSAGPWAQGAEFATSLVPEVATALATRGASLPMQLGAQAVVPFATTDGDLIDRSVAAGLNAGGYALFRGANKGLDVGTEAYKTYLKHPFTEEGRRINAKQSLMKYSSKPNALADNIANADAPLLNGSRYTLAEAIPGDQGLAQLQRLSVSSNPHFQNYLTSIRNKQNGTYDKNLSEMAGLTVDPKTSLTAFETAVQNRKLNASTNYGLAESTPLKLSRSAEKRAESLLERPIVKEAVTNARTNLANTGKVMEPEGSIQGLQHVRDFMSKRLASLGEDAPFLERNGLTVALKDMDKYLANVNPAFGKAQKAFKEDSVPINQMDVANLLRQRLFPPVTEFSEQIPNRITPASYMRSLVDRGGRDIDDARSIVKQATGLNKSLDDVMSGSQLYTIESIGKELARRQHVENAMKPAGESITGQLRSQQQDLLNRAPFAFLSGGMAIPAARAISTTLGKNFDDAASLTQRELARALASPRYAQKVMAQEIEPNWFNRTKTGWGLTGIGTGSGLDYIYQE